MVNKLREDGGFGWWWEEYEVFRRKYGLGGEYGQCIAKRKRLRREMRRTGWRSKQQAYVEAV